MRRKGHPFQAHFVYFSLFPNIRGRQEGDRGRFFVSRSVSQNLPRRRNFDRYSFLMYHNYYKYYEIFKSCYFSFQKGLFYAGYSQTEWHEKSNEKDG